jgi:HK97 family phage prohead protease
MKRQSYDGFLTKTDAPQAFTKADGESGEVIGYASKWWEVDSYGEFTIPGAFSRSINERGPKAANRIIFQYQHFIPVGKHLELEEDDTGLRVKARISDDGMDGTRLRRHLRDEIPYGLSIGFRRVNERAATPDDPLDLTNAPAWAFGEGGQPRYDALVGLSEIKLLENSAVSFPAVDSALVDGYRADIDLTQRAIDRLLLDLKRGVLTDAQITQLRAFAQTLPAASIPDGETPKPDAPQTADQRRNSFDDIQLVNEIRFVCATHGLPVWETPHESNRSTQSGPGREVA